MKSKIITAQNITLQNNFGSFKEFAPCYNKGYIEPTIIGNGNYNKCLDLIKSKYLNQTTSDERLVGSNIESCKEKNIISRNLQKVQFLVNSTNKITYDEFNQKIKEICGKSYEYVKEAYKRKTEM